MLKLFRYTHYDENGHRIDERVSNERYTSQFDSDPVDSAFGNLSSSFSSSIFLLLFFYCYGDPPDLPSFLHDALPIFQARPALLHICWSTQAIRVQMENRQFEKVSTILCELVHLPNRVPVMLYLVWHMFIAFPTR